MLDLLILGVSIERFSFREILYRNLGPAKIAWMARRHGYKAICIQKLQLLTEDEMVEICSRFIGPKTIIGISTTMMQYGSKTDYNDKDMPPIYIAFHNAVKRMREKYNNKIIIGGPSATYHAIKFNADKVVTGYGENSIVEYLRTTLGPRVDKRYKEVWDITSCQFRWHHTDFVQPEEVVPMETSRGCVFKCAYCSWTEIGKKKGTYERGLEYVRNEIIHNYTKFGIDHYILADDTFNDSEYKLNIFCDAVESLDFKIRFSGFTRLDLCHRFAPTMKRLYKCGFSGTNMGLETFHPEAAKVIGKAFNGTQKAKDFLDEFFYDICEGDIFITLCMIVGLPKESIEDILHHYQYLLERPYIAFHYSPLAIMDKDFHQDLSVFDQTYQEYGYTGEADKSISHMIKWKNDYMDHAQATELSMKLNNSPTRSKSVDAWNGMFFLNVLKKSPKELLNSSNLNDLKNQCFARMRIANSNYFNDVRNWDGTFEKDED